MSEKSPDLLLRTGHRERLRKNFLDNKLANYELLELLLSYAIPRKDVRPLARMLFKKFGGMFPILSASIDELNTVRGMGKNTAIFIKAVQQVLLEGYKCKFESRPFFHDRESLYNFCLLQLGGKQIEEMHVMYLNADGMLIKDETHSNGTINQTVLNTREVTKNALNYGAQFVVLVHNHPLPNKSFSQEDIAITEELIQCLNAVDIKLFDHLVVSGGIVYSYMNPPMSK